MLPIIIVHGGAGDIPTSRVEGKLTGVKIAVKAGYAVLLNGGSCLDAVEAAVVSMEKDENFNAGYGSVLNLDGNVEMEASIMRGSDLNAGAVTLISEFMHPISIARKVLEDTPHVMLGGEGARRFAVEKGFEPQPPESFITDSARKALENAKNHKEKEVTEIGVRDDDSKPDVGTVGAVAIDANGHIAVATSTGGMSGKYVGRIGDTPQIGSGTYADDAFGGVSTTGNGDAILKCCVAHAVIRNIETGQSAQAATRNAIEDMKKKLSKTAGAITLAKDGTIGVYFSSKRMAWACCKDRAITYGIERDETESEKI